MNVAPPPALSFRKVLDVLDSLDREGRALGEHRASPKVREGMAMALKQCPYSDSRLKHQYPINVSALKQLTTHWDEILAGIAFFRACHLKRANLPKVSRVIDVLRIGEAAACLPSYLVYRARDAIPDGELPVMVAALYKVVIGLNRVCWVLVAGEMMARGIENGAPPSAEDIALFADDGDFLIGGEQVCAGSPHQIEEAIGAICEGSHAGSATSTALESLVDPPEAFFTFADCMFRLQACKFLFDAFATLTFMDVAESLAEGPLRAKLTAGISSTDGPGTIQTFARTRSANQLEQLFDGCFTLAGGSAGARLRNPEPAEVADLSQLLATQLARCEKRETYPAPFLTAVERHLAIYLHFERRMRPVVEGLERNLNAALGRDPAARVQHTGSIGSELGLTPTSVLAEELGVELGPRR